MSKDVKFYGIGNDTSISSYNNLLNIIENNGENTNISVDKDSKILQDKLVTEAVNHIISSIQTDILEKNYSIEATVTTDEKLDYIGTYSDLENDDKGSDEWIYTYDPSLFDNSGEIKNIVQSEPMTMFENVGAYAITHRISDNPTKGNSALAGYAKWSDTDEVEKLIVAQTRPVAEIRSDIMQSNKDSNRCIANVTYSAYDSDHPQDERKGIREEYFYYKEISDTEWTEGRFPAVLPVPCSGAGTGRTLYQFSFAGAPAPREVLHRRSFQRRQPLHLLRNELLGCHEVKDPRDLFF